jgi:hypothetical protein
MGKGISMNRFYDQLGERIADQYDRYPIYREICRNHRVERADLGRIIRDRELHRRRGNPIFISPDGAEGCAAACIEQNDTVEPVSFFDDGSVREYTHVSRMTLEGCAYEYARGVNIL